MASGARWALMHELGVAAQPSLDDLLAQLNPCDLALVEGFKATTIRAGSYAAVHPLVMVQRHTEPALHRLDLHQGAACLHAACSLPVITKASLALQHPRVPYLKKIKLFAELPAESLSRIAEVAGLQRFSNHGFLFREGEEPDFVYSFIEGGIVLLGGADGQEAVIEFFGPGESMLLPAVLVSLPYLVSARATSDGQALLVPTSKFCQFMEDDSALAANCARALSRHWSALITQIKEIKTQGAAERLAHFLVSQSGKSNGPATLVLPGLKKEVATRLGIKPETLSRSLRKLRDYGVDTEGDTIRIASIERLAALTTAARNPITNA